MTTSVKPNGLFERLRIVAVALIRRFGAHPLLAWQGKHARPDRRRLVLRVVDAAGVLGSTDATTSEDVLALSSLPDADYADVCTLATDVDATPEQWARAMFGDVPDVAERLIWRGLLGMQLSRGRSPHTVAGWQIAERGEDWVRLEAASWYLSGNLVVRATDTAVSLATFVRYDRTLGRCAWPPLSVIHRGLLPGLLRDAAKKVRARQQSNGDLLRAKSPNAEIEHLSADAEKGGRLPGFVPSRPATTPALATPRSQQLMKLDDIAHTGRPWRLHALAHDFDLIDVWALPTPGGPGDLARLASIIAASDESLLSHPVVRALFSVRMKLGTWLGWDTVLDAALHGWSLRDRLPRDLRDGPRGPDIMTLVPFPSVYLTNTEWVAECSSKLVHMVQHVGWIPDGSGGHRAQLATLVRPKSRLGRLYVRGISPIRRHVVSPVQVRTIARDWEERSQVWEMTR